MACQLRASTSFALMKILILGGTYFIGRHIAGHLLQCGHDVMLLNRGTRISMLPTLCVDRNDPPAMRAALAGREYDVVIDTSCYDATQALIAEGALSGRYQRWMFLSSAAPYRAIGARIRHVWQEQHEEARGRTSPYRAVL